MYGVRGGGGAPGATLLYLWRILVVFGPEYTKFSQPRLVIVTSAQFRSVEAGGFDADEDPVFGW